MKKYDIRPGMTFHSWTALDTPDYSIKYPKVLCRCVCGREKMVDIYSLIRGTSKSCGCQVVRRPPKDYGIHPGDKIGYWTILSRHGRYFSCKCVCGEERTVSARMLVSGRSRSCGCHRADSQTDAQRQGKRKGQRIMREIHAAGLAAAYTENRKTNKNSSTGVLGVSLLPKIKKYRAYLTIDRKQIHLGSFMDIEDAKAARKAAEEKYFKPKEEKLKEIKRYEKNNIHE